MGRIVRSELTGMHGLGARGSVPVASADASGGLRFLGASLFATLVLLVTGLLALQALDTIGVGVLLVACSLSTAYLMPFLWNNLFRQLRTA